MSKEKKAVNNSSPSITKLPLGGNRNNNYI